MSSPLRVFQVASGNVGTEMVKRIQKHPDLELVGLHCYSPEKVGRYIGKVGGTPRVELQLEWQMTPHTDPHWNIQGCYITKIDGDPCIYSKHLILPKPGTDFSSVAAFAAIGMTVTGMPALNSIRAVVDAPPGIVTSADLPLRAFAGRFAR